MKIPSEPARANPADSAVRKRQVQSVELPAQQVIWERGNRNGLLLGAVAVIFWSFGSSLIYLGAREAGTWRFVAIASIGAGAMQLVWRRLHHGELRTALILPWPLWVAPVAAFVVYGLAWPCALASSNAAQVGGVNLINYLWPILTVVFGIWLVPGLKLTIPAAIAMGLALAGLVCANAKQVLLSNVARNGTGLTQWLPFILALIAAVTWAFYSCILVRWAAWSSRYVTSPIGFILIGLVACVVLACSETNKRKLDGAALLMTLLYGLGPLAAGYLLWELALARARIQPLSMLAAATPLLSTFLLALCLRKLPGPELMLAALLISGGILLSVRK